MGSNDNMYFYQRAQAELEQAQRATHANAVAAHYQLAEAYLERVSSTATGNAIGRGLS